MKSEFNYGIKTNYTVYLYANQLGSDRERLREICYANRSPAVKWGTFKSLDHDFEEDQLVWSWYWLTEDACYALVEELEEIGVVPKVCGNVLYQAFQNHVLVADYPKRYPHLESKDIEKIAQQRNNWFSQVLSDFTEYALELWAVGEKIDTAYRLTIIPSFGDAQIIRLWLKNNTAYFVKYVAGKYLNCTLDYEEYSEGVLPSENWQKMETFMQGNFWMEKTWYSHYGSELRDGVIYLFEGWRDGEYKFLDDHSPSDKDSLSSQAIRLFQSLN